MFSGIIEHKAKILNRDGGLFCVENTFDDELTVGQSIAHDGACMTLTHVEKDFYEFFVMEESRNVTNFKEKNIGEFFNVERAVLLSDRLDGHMVTGHVDTVGKVILTETMSDGSCFLTVSFPDSFDGLLIRKGSITINGVSLTVVNCSRGEFTVSLIPLTQDWTNLGNIKIGTLVNLEFDLFAKYIKEHARNYLQNLAK